MDPPSRLTPPFTGRGMTPHGTDGSTCQGASHVWSGTWVSRQLGISLQTIDEPIGVRLEVLVGLALRRNPRRAHLLVSTVLGKHVPADPRLVYGSGLLLGGLVSRALEQSLDEAAGVPRDLPGGELLRRALSGDQGAADALVEHGQPRQAHQASRPERIAVVVGYAETATALGHTVADALGAPVLHSTRRPVDGVVPVGYFEEEHSHATSHLLLPEEARLLTGSEPLVLVDDELSTGTTVLNTIAALHGVAARDRYVVAALVDLRGNADRERMRAVGAELGARIEVVALGIGRVTLPEGTLDRAQQLVARIGAAEDSPSPLAVNTDGCSKVSRVGFPWPEGLREGGRHGFDPEDAGRLSSAVQRVASQVAMRVPMSCSKPVRVHVLGFEELMYAPLLLGLALTGELPRARVTYSCTTRSPVLAVSDEGYSIRRRIVFPAHDGPADGPGDRFAYNLPATTDVDPRFDMMVLVVDQAGDSDQLWAPLGLLDQLRAVADTVLLVTLPVHRPAGASWPRPTPDSAETR